MWGADEDSCGCEAGMGIVVENDAAIVLEEVKKTLREAGEPAPTDSDAIMWLADTINTYVDEIQRLEHELNLYKNSVPVEAMR